MARTGLEAIATSLRTYKNVAFFSLLFSIQCLVPVRTCRCDYAAIAVLRNVCTMTEQWRSAIRFSSAVMAIIFIVSSVLAEALHRSDNGMSGAAFGKPV